MADQFKQPMDTGAREWDAATYDEVSDPQFEWGMEVLERLELRGDEAVVDAGCGSGRVTEQLAGRLPNGRVIAVDGSEAMIEKAKERLGDRAEYLVSDLVELTLPEPVDLVFSTATFHWIGDHDRLFRQIRLGLRPGGRLVAQCGGKGNVARHTEAIAAVAADSEYGQHLTQAKGLWNFASPEETEPRLNAAGFSDIRCWLQPKPVQPSRPLEFISTVTLGPLLDQLPEEKRRPFAEAVLAEHEEPLTLDYVRLNIEARRVPAS
ncbi:MAG TPA: methyltransferase domain-containing protein, partial [Solirubrobacterales bacterium]|nr:methyltransferase domain-containing protein [Solirubrobacterales bacterium]